MDFSEQNIICRLCLMKLTENCEPIEEILRHTLNFLTLCPNLAISDDPMVCETCAVNLKKCFDFKLRCLSTEDCVASFVEGENKKVDLRDIYSKVKLDGNIGRVPDDHSVCRFCLGLVKDYASMSVRHDLDLVAILQIYFLEMNLRITDDIIACTPCYNSLRFHVSFVNNHLSIEGKIDEYCEVEGANYKDQVDLRDVASFKSKSMLNVQIISSLIVKEDKHENIVNSNLDVKIKLENSTDVDQEKEKLVYQEIQQSNNNRVQNCSIDSQSDSVPDLTRTKPANYTCEICGYQTGHKDHFQTHILTHKSIAQEAKYMLNHKDASEVMMYRCTMCSYQSKRKRQLQFHMISHKDDTEVTMYNCRYETKSDLNSHMLTHKTLSETTMYKCKECTYEDKCKNCLQQHKLKLEIELHKYELHPFKAKWKRKHLLSRRKTPDVVTRGTMFKCYHCDYETNLKSNLERHMIIHKIHSEITMYKCDLCDHKTKWKAGLKRHMLTHKTRSEVTMYKCEMCTYETKHNYYLQRHMLTHKTHSETTMYKCEECAYETKDKNYLRKHKLQHKEVSEVEMHKCELCPFKAKWKRNLKKHLLRHTSTPKVVTRGTTFKCDLCDYGAKRKFDLKRHMLTHRNPSEITMYKCDLCDYEAKQKSHLKGHMLTHGTLSETTMYKCYHGDYETTRKDCLRQHMLTHMDRSKIEMHKCEVCPFETKWKKYLRKHLLSHRNPLDV